MRSIMDDYGTICKKLAEQYGSGFIDLQAMFDNGLSYKQASFMSADRIHPNSVGATMIAKEFLSYCGFDFNHTI